MFVTQLLVLGLAVQNIFASRWQRRLQEEKGEEMGSIMATESVGGGLEHVPGSSGKGSAEMHIYGRGSP